MNPKRIRETLFLLVFCILGCIAALQLVRSVPRATVFYLIGVALLFMILEPFAGLIAYLAFFYLRPQELIPGFSAAPLALIIGAAALVSMLVSEGVKRRSPAFGRAPQDYLLIWLFFAIVVSHAANFRFGDAFSAGYGFLHVIVLYILITNLVSDTRRLNIVLHCLGLLTLWLAAEGLIVYYTGSAIGGAELKGGRVLVRAFAWDPNLGAAGLMLILPFFYLEMNRQGNKARRLYSAFAIVVVCYVIALTQSRGGAVTLAIVGAVLLIRTKGWMKGTVLGMLAVVAIFLLGPSRFRELDPTEPSAFGRLMAWDRAFGEFRGNPVFGIGSRQFGGDSGLVPHNALMQTAAELGLFGLVPWVLLLFVSMKNVIFVRRHAAETGHERLGLLNEALFFACLVWVVSLLFVGNAYYDHLYIVLGLCVAATNIYVKVSENHYRLIEKRDVGYTLFLIGLGLAAHRLFLYLVGL